MIPPAPSATASTSTTTGFSLSPGGLLLPYHVGALAALEYNQQLHPHTPIAGSSAGSIAVAAHACGISPAQVVDATGDIAEECQAAGGAAGRLLGPLREKLTSLITDDEFLHFQNREGRVAIAYQQVLPLYQSMHVTEFEDREDLITSICHSSTFPFFTTKWPAVVDTSRPGIPRLVVDGFFAVPRARFGCPDFAQCAGVHVDRTVTISVFPQDTIRLEASAPRDCISPPYDAEDGSRQMQTLLRQATQASSRTEYAQIYEAGWRDAERWCREHADGDKNENEDASSSKNSNNNHDETMLVLNDAALN